MGGTAMNLLLPLLITFIIVSIFIVLIVRITKGKAKYIYGKRIHWILGGYVTILLICFILDTLNPSKEMADLKRLHGKDLMKENTQLYNAAVEGKIDKVGDKYIDKKWNFNFNGEKLNLVAENGGSFDTQIVVERKKTNDGKIDAAYYKARSSINDMEITNMTYPIGVKLMGDTLMLANQKEVKIKFSQFENVFSIKQFSGENWFSHHSDFTEGQSVLYLRIPKNLELINQSEINLEILK
jgi:hypothetical protein